MPVSNASINITRMIEARRNMDLNGGTMIDPAKIKNTNKVSTAEWDDAFTPMHPEEILISDEKTEEQDEMVHHPPHYVKDNGVECIEWIELMLTPEEFRGYLKGCACKYMWRHDLKGNRRQDLQKAQWYLNYLEGC